jgi:peptidoglycan/LPS O-acetylase OafA/YrhL
MLSTPEITHQPHRRHRRLRLRLHLLCVSVAGLLLFPFCVFHGINKSDAFYSTELAVAWIVALGGGYSGIRAFKRGGRSQRIIVLIALALIGSSVATITLLNRAPEFSLPRPSSPDSE